VEQDAHLEPHRLLYVIRGDTALHACTASHTAYCNFIRHVAITVLIISLAAVSHSLLSCSHGAGIQSRRFATHILQQQQQQQQQQQSSRQLHVRIKHYIHMIQ
jgi:hypothetical protein